MGLVCFGMKISTRARYALRMMLDIGRYGDRRTPVSITLVAERTGISRGYLEQLAMALRNARLLRAVAGRYGGYKLATETDDITIRMIIEAAIGPISVVDCVDEPETCPRSDYCECRVVYALINQRVAGVLEDFTLADLLDKRWTAVPIAGSFEDLVSLDAQGCGMPEMAHQRVAENRDAMD
jgi:Rrf2 family protein